MPTKRGEIKIRTILIGVGILMVSLFLVSLFLVSFELLILRFFGVDIFSWSVFATDDFWRYVLGFFVGTAAVRLFVTKRPVIAVIIFCVAFLLLLLITLLIIRVISGPVGAIEASINETGVYFPHALLGSFIGFLLAQRIEKIFGKEGKNV